MHETRFFFETLLARAAEALAPRFPRRLLRTAARAAGMAAYLACGGLRRIALANLELAFGASLSKKEKRRIAARSFQNFAQVLLDCAWFSRQTVKRISEYVSIETEALEKLARTPVVGVAAHFGNWELLSRALALNGMRHVAVAAAIKNPAVDALLNKLRSVPGVQILPRRHAIRGALRALRDGRHAAFLLDQNVKPQEGGIFVRFFGSPALMSTAASVLSRRTAAPVMPLFCEIRGDGGYRIYSTELIEAKHFAAVAEMTQAIASEMEKEIRRAPEQWLWMYKRWKYIDPAEPQAKYPFYRKPLTRPAAAPEEPQTNDVL